MSSRTALVTGGSRGIGLGIVRALAADGYDVAFTYTSSEERARNAADDVAAASGRTIHIIKAALEERDTAPAAVHAAIEKLGHLDVLVSNAGRTILQHMLKMDVDTLDFIYNLNFRSYVLAARTAAEHMRDRGKGGNIVFITSTRGDSPHYGDGAYGGLKAGIQRATKSFAMDLSQFGIRVNSVAPGCIPMGKEQDERYTEAFENFRMRIPLQRFGVVEDVAGAVSWLISDKASYVTGQTITVDGGLSVPGMTEIGYRSPKTQRGEGKK